MSDDHDFAALYRELGIDATCGPEEFRRAYRRRVARLHPDQGGDAQDVARLQWLNHMVDAALSFHQRFGRLPGAPHASSPAATPAARPQDAPRGGHEDTAASGFGRPSRWFVAVAVVGMGALLWRIVDHDRLRTDLSDQARTGIDATPPERRVDTITAGMGSQTVLELQGEPHEMQGQRWHYGPSWIEFRCGKVVDWYSSPLAPLAVGSPRAAPAAVAAAYAKDCP